ncbi:unnamed protein product, partial [Prorocentrum cordatum]
MLRDRPPLRVAQHKAELMNVMKRFNTDPTLPRDWQMAKVDSADTSKRYDTFDPCDGWVVVDDLLANWTGDNQWKGYQDMRDVLIKGNPHSSDVYWVLLNCCEMIDNHGMQKGRLQMKC